MQYSSGIMIVIVKPKLPKWEYLSSIAHEVSHAIDFMMDDMGERNPSSEFKAYAIGYLTSNMVKQYEKWWKK